MSIVITASFLAFLAAFTAIGILSSRRKQTTTEDYLVASRDVNPWLAALSAVSTNNSGYMFIGLIGFTWRSGVEGVWIAVGWVLGDYLSWLWVHRRVRRQSGAFSLNTVPSMLARDTDGRSYRSIAIVAGLLTFLFLGGYAGAQLKAGSTALYVLFDWPMWVGSVIGVVVVVVYCFAGGIRASIWTDTAQSIVMMGSMLTLLGYAWYEVGGPSALMDALHAIDPALVAWQPQGLAFGLGAYVLGYVAAGAVTAAQPHVLIRFMALDDEKSIPKARRIYFLWFTIFHAIAVFVGLYARVLLPDLTAGLEGADAVAATEAALPHLSMALLPAVLVGMMLAGIFAATMSTADSQILSCSAAVTQDMFPRWEQSYTASKVATISVAFLALAVALGANQGVFDLVLLAWGVFGAAFGPVLVVRLANQPLDDKAALAMMATGIAVIIAWGNSPWAGAVYKVLPGLIAPFLVYGLWRVTLGRGRRTTDS